MSEDTDELEQQYVQLYKELLFHLDKLFLLQNNSLMNNELEWKSRLRAKHQLNVAETAALLNMKDSTNDKHKQIQAMLQNKYTRDGELRRTIETHWNLIQDWLEETEETRRLQNMLQNVSSKFPDPPRDPQPDPQLAQTLEMLESIYSVLLVQGGYQEKLYHRHADR